MARLFRGILTATIFLASIAVALALAESILRPIYLKDPWVWRNLATEPINQQVTNLAILYDPVVGYIAKPDLRSGPTNTHGRMGVRLHVSLKKGEPSPPLPVGGILASGDSFTFGSEVDDHQSWPAQLERMLGVSVVNAGAGGYGLDQAVLRAEQFLDVIKPRAIVISFIPNAMGRNEYSVNSGLPKSYFDVVDGKLELRNVPVARYKAAISHVGAFRALFGYSYAMYWAADRLGLKNYFVASKHEVRKVHGDGVEVGCLLWVRLKEKTAGRNIKLFALAQYAGVQVGGDDNSRDHFQVEKVMACAEKAGYILVDSYAALRKSFETDPVGFWNYWVKQPHDRGRHTGHMSASGNRFTSELLAKTINAAAPELLKR
jgi:hypothetical protein